MTTKEVWNRVHNSGNLFTRLDQIEYVSPDTLTPYANSPRKHSAKKLAKLAASLRSFGLLTPLLVTSANVVIAGEARLRSVVQSWDTASSIESTADWSVCLTWGLSQGKWYLIDVFRQRLEYPDLKKAVLRLAKVHEPDEVLIERAASGLALLQELRSERKLKAIAFKACLDKQERLIACTAQLEEGRFLLPREALWLDTFLSEVRAFPNGRHDDQVDAMSHFITFQTRKRLSLEAERHAVTGRILRNAPRPQSRRGVVRPVG